MQVEIQIGLQKRDFSNTFSEKRKCQYFLPDLEMSDHYREVRVRTRIIRIDKHKDIQREKLRILERDLPWLRQRGYIRWSNNVELKMVRFAGFGEHFCCVNIGEVGWS